MDLLVDLRAFIDVIPDVGKISFRLGTSLPKKRLRPKKAILCLEVQIGKRLVI